jgi:hypothetical protein
MPTVIHKDTVAQALVETTSEVGQVGRKVRGALIAYGDLPLSTPDPFVLEKCIALLGDGWQLKDPLPGSEDYAGGVPLKVRRHLARARTADIIQIDTYYEPDSQQYPPGSFFARDDTSVVTVQTNLLPGTRRPIRCSWKDPKDPNNSVATDYCPIKYQAPYRVIQISGKILGMPPAGQRQMIRHVNNADWVGHPKGYWLMERYTGDTKDRGNSFDLSCQVASWEEHDWSEYGILRNHHTGRFVQVTDQEMDDLVAMPYKYGIIPRNGVVRVGPYREANFAALFGDLIDSLH